MTPRVCICLVLVLTYLTVLSIESVESRPSPGLYKCRPGAMYCDRKNGKRSYARKQVGVQIYLEHYLYWETITLRTSF